MYKRRFEVIDTVSDTFVVMEYVSGELFDFILSRGRLPPDDARQLFQQVCQSINQLVHQPTSRFITVMS